MGTRNEDDMDKSEKLKELQAHKEEINRQIAEIIGQKFQVGAKVALTGTVTDYDRVDGTYLVRADGSLVGGLLIWMKPDSLTAIEEKE